MGRVTQETKQNRTKHPRVWNFTTSWVLDHPGMNHLQIMPFFWPRILADLENHDLSPTVPTYKASLIKPYRLDIWHLKRQRLRR